LSIFRILSEFIVTFLGTLPFLRHGSVFGKPADVVKAPGEYASWRAKTQERKLYIHAEPGALDSGRARDFCRTWPNQREITVKAIHFVQEDSAAVADFVRELRARIP
jgi:haloalkane dehalogenase